MLDELPDDSDALTDDAEDNSMCVVNLNTDNHRPCKAKAIHDDILGEIDASLDKKTLTVTEAPHLDTKPVIAKLDVFAKTIDLDVSRILAEQMKDTILGTVGSWLRKRTLLRQNHPRFNNPRGYSDFAKSSTDL